MHLLLRRRVVETAVAAVEAEAVARAEESKPLMFLHSDDTITIFMGGIESLHLL